MRSFVVLERHLHLFLRNVGVVVGSRALSSNLLLSSAYSLLGIVAPARLVVGPLPVVLCSHLSPLNLPHRPVMAEGLGMLFSIHSTVLVIQLVNLWLHS